MAIKKKVIGRSEEMTVNKNSINNNSSWWTEFSKHLMTGISYMIPVLIMGGLIGAFSQIIPYVVLGLSPDVGILEAMNMETMTSTQIQLLNLSQLMSSFGFTLFGFAIPLFAAFTAYSIGGKTALVSGFIGGYVANNPIGRPTLVDGSWEIISPVPSGFLGALIIAFIIGYFVKFLNQKIKVSRNWMAFKTTFLVPLLSAIVTMILMIFVITPMGGAINGWIESMLKAAGESGEYVYALLLSATTAFDLGGPVNKAAGFVALGFTTERLLPITARTIAIVTPSIGLGLSTLIDRKLVGRKVYDEQFYEAGKTSIFLALMGISEGAIPFALERPAFVIPLYVIGSIIGAFTGIALGAVQWFPESAIWAWPLVTNIFAYVIGILVGSLIIAVANVYYRNRLINQGKI